MCLVQLFTVVVSDVRARTAPTMNTEPLKGLLTHNPYNACNIYYVEGACACTRVCLVRACVHACVPVRTRVHVTCVCVRARFLRMCVCVCVCGQGLGFVVFDDTPYKKKNRGLGLWYLTTLRRRTTRLRQWKAAKCPARRSRCTIEMHIAVCM